MRKRNPWLALAFALEVGIGLYAAFGLRGDNPASPVIAGACAFAACATLWAFFEL